MERIFVDTGAWFSYFNAADPDHEAVSEVLAEWESRLLTTDYVFDEVVTLVRFRVGHPEARKSGEALRSGDIAALIDVETIDRDAAWKRFVRDQDKVYSYTDCTSFSVMDRIGLTTVAAVDEDFRRAGFRVLPA